jgi:hypothetical protein
MIFLIEYDRPQGELVNLQVFDDSHRDDAENARLRRELTLHRTGVRREVVLLQAASEAALKETHRRYFADTATLAEAMIG